MKAFLEFYVSNPQNVEGVERSNFHRAAHGHNIRSLRSLSFSLLVAVAISDFCRRSCILYTFLCSLFQWKEYANHITIIYQI
jgi:hypothetical protein